MKQHPDQEANARQNHTGEQIQSNRIGAHLAFPSSVIEKERRKGLRKKVIRFL
jgi:hypothetical protein